jgi:hypothetical protein
VVSGYDENHPLYDWISAILAVRAEREALRRGDLTFRWASEAGAGTEDAGLLAIERATPDDRALVVINTSATQTSQTVGGMETGFAPGTRLVDRLPSDVQRSYTVGSDGRILVELRPRESVVLVADGT